MLDAFKQNHISHLTEVQQLAINEGILTGTNMLITGEGGSGKTLAYLMPILNSFFKKTGRRDPTQFIMDTSNEDTMF